MLELYHNAVSTCSQKVRLVLAHKGLEFTPHEIDLLHGGQHDPEYVKLNPNHVVPTLVDDGQVFIESSLINEYLEDAFPRVPMMPETPAGRHAVRSWIKQVDEQVHPVTGIVTFAIGPRSVLIQQPEEVREASILAIPDPKKQAVRRSVIEHGVKAPEFAGALGAMLGLLDRVNAVLQPGQWLGGDIFSLADATVVPYVLRLDALAMTPVIEARPNLAEWFARLQALPAYETAVTAWSPPPLVELFRANGEAVWNEVEPLTRGD